MQEPVAPPTHVGTAVSLLAGALTTRGVLRVALSGAIAVLLAVFAASGSYALWAKSTPASPRATLTSGSASLQLTGALALPATPLYPGLTVYGAASVKNTGNVPVVLRVAGVTGPTVSTVFSQSVVLGVRVVASALVCDGSVAPTWTGTFGAAPGASLGSGLAVGATAVLCISVALPVLSANGSQGQTASSFSVLVDGQQQ